MMDEKTRKTIAKAVAALVAAVVLWLLGWLCGCSVKVTDGDLDFQFGYPKARQHWNVTIDPRPPPASQPAGGAGGT